MVPARLARVVLRAPSVILPALWSPCFSGLLEPYRFSSICNSQVAGAAINVAGGALFARFSRQDEAEADNEGFKNVLKAGISPAGMVTMFQKLLDERKSRPAGVEAWFLTHPLEEDRITAIQTQINQLPTGTLARLGTDTRNFHAFKSRIQSLPPSPPPRQVQ